MRLALLVRDTCIQRPDEVWAEVHVYEIVVGYVVIQIRPVFSSQSFSLMASFVFSALFMRRWLFA
jgi:hypothetical protein